MSSWRFVECELMEIAEQLEILRKGSVDLIREEDLKEKLERLCNNGQTVEGQARP